MKCVYLKSDRGKYALLHSECYLQCCMFINSVPKTAQTDVFFTLWFLICHLLTRLHKVAKQLLSLAG